MVLPINVTCRNVSTEEENMRGARCVTPNRVPSFKKEFIQFIHTILQRGFNTGLTYGPGFNHWMNPRTYNVMRLVSNSLSYECYIRRIVSLLPARHICNTATVTIRHHVCRIPQSQPLQFSCMEHQYSLRWLDNDQTPVLLRLSRLRGSQS